jgi:Uma2 family endonuclease
MPANTLMTAEEYLRTSFEDGDFEYVDGEIVDRNIGEITHGSVQALLGSLLWERAASLALSPATSVRIRINSSRFRVADLAAWPTRKVVGDQYGIPLAAPFLAVEILSSEERMSDFQRKIKDYLSIGVQWIWLLDPTKETALCFSQTDPEGSPCDVLRTENPTIEIPLKEVLDPQA